MKNPRRRLKTSEKILITIFAIGGSVFTLAILGVVGLALLFWIAVSPPKGTGYDPVLNGKHILCIDWASGSLAIVSGGTNGLYVVPIAVAGVLGPRGAFVIDDRLYVTAHDAAGASPGEHLWRLDLATGQFVPVLDLYEHGLDPYRVTTWRDEFVFADRSGGILRFNPLTSVWTPIPLPADRLEDSPFAVCVDGLLYFDSEYALVCVDEQGTLKWTMPNLTAGRPTWLAAADEWIIVSALHAQAVIPTVLNLTPDPAWDAALIARLTERYAPGGFSGIVADRDGAWGFDSSSKLMYTTIVSLRSGEVHVMDDAVLSGEAVLSDDMADALLRLSRPASPTSAQP